MGIDPGRVTTWMRRGDVERVARGLYRRTDAELTGRETLAMVARLVPLGVFCLGTALHFHAIGTQAPPDVWIGVPHGFSRRTFAGLPVRVVKFTPYWMEQGVETHDEQGTTLRVTSPARTVVDCFRRRNKIGIDVAVEALRDVVRQRKAKVDDILRLATAAGVRNVMRPYLEAVLG